MVSLQQILEYQNRNEAWRAKHEAAGTFDLLRQVKYRMNVDRLERARFETVTGADKAREVASGAIPAAQYDYDTATGGLGEVGGLNFGAQHPGNQDPATHYARAFLRGFLPVGDALSGVGALAQGVTGGLVPADNPLNRAGAAVNEFTESVAPLRPDLADGFGTVLAGGAGSLASAVTGGAVGKALGGGGKLATALGAALPQSSALAGMIYDEAGQAGAGRATQLGASALGWPIGALDAILPLEMLGGSGAARTVASKTLAEAAEKASARSVPGAILRGGAVEGVQEGVQQVAQNAVANMYEDRDLTENVGTSALAGVLLGGPFAGLNRYANNVVEQQRVQAAVGEQNKHLATIAKAEADKQKARADALKTIQEFVALSKPDESVMDPDYRLAADQRAADAARHEYESWWYGQDESDILDPERDFALAQPQPPSFDERAQSVEGRLAPLARAADQRQQRRETIDTLTRQQQEQQDFDAAVAQKTADPEMQGLPDELLRAVQQLSQDPVTQAAAGQILASRKPGPRPKVAGPVPEVQRQPPASELPIGRRGTYTPPKPQQQTVRPTSIEGEPVLPEATGPNVPLRPDLGELAPRLAATGQFSQEDIETVERLIGAAAPGSKVSPASPITRPTQQRSQRTVQRQWDKRAEPERGRPALIEQETSPAPRRRRFGNVFNSPWPSAKRRDAFISSRPDTESMSRDEFERAYAEATKGQPSDDDLDVLSVLNGERELAMTEGRDGASAEVMRRVRAAGLAVRPVAWPGFSGPTKVLIGKPARVAEAARLIEGADTQSPEFHAELGRLLGYDQALIDEALPFEDDSPGTDGASFLGRGFVYRSPAGPDEADSIAKNGLKGWAHVGTSPQSQGFDGEVVLVFRSDEVNGVPKDHNPGDARAGNSGAKPVAIFVDESAFGDSPALPTFDELNQMAQELQDALAAAGVKDPAGEVERIARHRYAAEDLVPGLREKALAFHEAAKGHDQADWTLENGRPAESARDRARQFADQYLRAFPDIPAFFFSRSEDGRVTPTGTLRPGRPGGPTRYRTTDQSQPTTTPLTDEQIDAIDRDIFSKILPRGVFRNFVKQLRSGKGEPVLGRQFGNVIQVSVLQDVASAERTSLHEVMHWFWNHPRSPLSPAMRNALRRHAASRLGQNPTEEDIDEFIAEEFAQRAYTRLRQSQPLVARAYEAIEQFIRKLGNLLRGRGFHTPQSIYDAIGAGRMRRVNVGVGRGSSAESRYATDARHVSPHLFNKFELSDRTIGTGEGHQSYGHGLYFLTSEEVERHYRTQFSADRPVAVLVDGVAPQTWRPGRGQPSVASEAEHWVRSYDGKVIDAIEALRSRLGGGPVDSSSIRKHLANTLALLESGRVTVAPPAGPHTYKVSLKPEADEWLDWDKPLSEQSEKVRDALAKIRLPVRDLGAEAWETEKAAHHVAKSLGLTDYALRLDEHRSTPGRKFYQIIAPWTPSPGQDGASLYDLLSTRVDREGINKAAASKALHAAGIPGIRYLDGSSRHGAADGQWTVHYTDANEQDHARTFDSRKKAETFANKVALGGGVYGLRILNPASYNYVVFDDSLIDIKERYRTKDIDWSTEGIPEPPAIQHVGWLKKHLDTLGNIVRSSNPRLYQIIQSAKFTGHKVMADWKEALESVTTKSKSYTSAFKGKQRQAIEEFAGLFVAGRALRDEMARHQALSEDESVPATVRMGARRNVKAIQSIIDAVGFLPEDVWDIQEPQPGQEFELHFPKKDGTFTVRPGRFIEQRGGQYVFEQWSESKNEWVRKQMPLETFMKFQRGARTQVLKQDITPQQRVLMDGFVKVFREKDDAEKAKHDAVAGDAASGRIANHWYQRPNDNFLAAEFDPKYANLRRDYVSLIAWDSMNPEKETFAEAEARVKNHLSDYKPSEEKARAIMGAFEKSRQLHLPVGIADWSMQGALSYAYRAGMVRSLFEQGLVEFEQNDDGSVKKDRWGRQVIARDGKERKTPDYFLWKQVNETPESEKNLAAEYMEDILGAAQMTKATGPLESFFKGTANAQYATRLSAPYLMAQQVAQVLGPGAFMGLRNTWGSYAKFLVSRSARARMRDAARRAGVEGDPNPVNSPFMEPGTPRSEFERVTQEIATKGRVNIGGMSLPNPLLWMNLPFHALEANNRVIAGEASALYMSQLIERARGGKPKGIAGVVQFGEFSPDGAKARALRLFGNIDEALFDSAVSGDQAAVGEVLDRARFKGAEEVNFRADADFQPQILRSPMAAPFRTFQTFAYNATRVFVREVFAEAQRGNIAPAMRLLTAAGVTGQLLNILVGALRDKERESDYRGLAGTANPMDRMALAYVENLMAAGMLTQFSNLGQTLSMNSAQGVNLSSIKNVIDWGRTIARRPEDMQTWADATKDAALRQFSGVRGYLEMLESVGLTSAAQVKNANQRTASLVGIYIKDRRAKRPQDRLVQEQALHDLPNPYRPQASRIADALFMGDIATAFDVIRDTVPKMVRDGMTHEEAYAKLRAVAAARSPLHQVGASDERLAEFMSWLRQRGTDPDLEAVARHRVYDAQLDILFDF